MPPKKPQSPFHDGEVVLPNDPRRKPAELTPNSHALDRHDHAAWHPDLGNKLKAVRLGDMDQAQFEKLVADRAAGKSKSEPLPYQDRSKFDSKEVMKDAIQKSNQYPAVVHPNGNLVVCFEMDYEVGDWVKAKKVHDPAAGKPKVEIESQERTRTVTVVMKPDGEVITAYCGRGDLPLPKVSGTDKIDPPKKTKKMKM